MNGMVKNCSTLETTNLLLELNINNDGFEFNSSINAALMQAELEVQNINETIESIKKLQPTCDKLDYALAASIGALSGLMDIFFVGKPGESPLGDISDKWFDTMTVKFAEFCGWNSKNESVSSAIKFLENKFKIPYDQRGAGDAASSVFEIDMKNHHFKSLAHNPSICGLFFSILDQFTNSSHFVTGGELISLVKADEKFKLMGKNNISKFFCAIINWFGHIISDVLGSSNSTSRGMGIPSPLWTWTNDIIALKNKLHIPVSEFNESINELALNIYKKGFDARFQLAQVIPVFINEMIVRFVYSIRRLIKYFSKTDKDSRSFSLMWKECEPFANSTVKRMLTVAHGTFCLVDIGDSTVRSYVSGKGQFNPVEFFLRLNVAGIGRFTISLYGEAKREIYYIKAKGKITYALKEKSIIEDYINELEKLYKLYDDKYLLTFVDDFKKSNLYIEAFNKSVELARLRQVPVNKILMNKSDIDKYFRRENNYE